MQICSEGPRHVFPDDPIRQDDVARRPRIRPDNRGTYREVDTFISFDELSGITTWSDSLGIVVVVGIDQIDGIVIDEYQ
ncbi:hypothetical protein [Nocardia rhizosphaerae]|uniref:Uncharacterized protein n=1 Tax=Nocardia rhizosphaerae TaxID=1691571 RepID=A0ABV8LBQ7_9NOCA